MNKEQKTRVLEILKKAQKLIDTPNKWTQKAMARDPEGNSVIAPYPDENMNLNGYSFCVIGAIRCLAGRDYNEAFCASDIAKIALYNTLNTDSLGEWNDTPGRRHEDVLKAFANAIALVETEETQ